MIDYDKIKKLKSNIAINSERLKTETDIVKKEKLRLKIQIDTLKIKICNLD